MTLPPQCFGTHDGRALLSRVREQPLNTGAEFVRHHDIGVTAKGFIAPQNIWRIRSHPAPSAQLWKMDILDSRLREFVREIFLVKMWQASRTGEPSHISQ